MRGKWTLAGHLLSMANESLASTWRSDSMAEQHFRSGVGFRFVLWLAAEAEEH